MQFVILGFLIIGVIAFGVIVWKAAPNWRWYQITAVSITMLLGIIFLFPVAGILKSRSAWHQLKEKADARVADLADQQAVLKFGDPQSNETEVREGLVSLSTKLAKLNSEAGRHWRNLRRVSQGGFPIRLASVDPAAVAGLPADDAAAAGAGDRPLIRDGMVVYGFGERVYQGTAVSVPVPSVYLGEYRVTASTPTEVSIEPTGKLLASQIKALNTQEANSWSLYELLPLDGHEPFVAEGSTPSGDNLFGRVDEEFVNQLLKDRVNAETFAQYLHDGQRATDQDPLLARWVKVEFVKKYELEVDSEQQRSALDAAFFAADGRAVDSRLQRGDGGKVQIAAGEQVVLKEEAADEVIAAGQAKLIDRYYMRPLNDYRLLTRRIALRLASLELRKVELEFELGVIQNAISETESATGLGQEAREKLEQDLAQIQTEAKAIRTYHDDVKGKVSSMKRTLVELYRSNQQLEAELTARHQGITQRANALVAAP
ncbi:MAG: hypothetical protein AAGA03_08925 [Planctomycetota bacterium]